MFAKNIICPTCGYKGKPATKVKGNIILEIVLWLIFLVPGFIYSIWRSTSRYKACPSCGSTQLVPYDSPRGQQLLAEFDK